MVRGQLRARSSVGMSVRFASERSRVRLPSSPYNRKPFCRSYTAGRFSCLQCYETVRTVPMDMEPVQRWQITAFQTLKVLKIKVSCGLTGFFEEYEPVFLAGKNVYRIKKFKRGAKICGNISCAPG